MNGAIIFKSMVKNAKRVNKDNFPDLTGYECFLNHIHIEDYLDISSPGPQALLKQGVVFALHVKNQLEKFFQHSKFRLIVAFNESGCNVRFHCLRLGEKWLSEDLEQDTGESILVLE
jgi:hypothetical protein